METQVQFLSFFFFVFSTETVSYIDLDLDFMLLNYFTIFYWLTGLEYLQRDRGTVDPTQPLRYHHSWPLGQDISHLVAQSRIRVGKKSARL